MDAGIWYLSKRVSQAAADSGALAAALEVMRLEQDENYTVSESELKVIATAVAAENGYDAGEGDAIEVNYPPKSGPYAGTAGAVEVIVSQPAGVFLARLLTDRDGITVAGRAVAVGGVKDECVYALSETGSAVSASGGAAVNLPCGIAANSVDDSALVTNGGACITATKIKVVGGMTGRLHQSEDGCEEHPVHRPFCQPWRHHLAWAAVSTTRRSMSKNGDDVKLKPGVYCGGISVSGGSLTFEAGQYTFDGSGLSVSGGAVSGDDVSFYITADSGQGDNISISSDSAVNLSAAPGGEMPGVLFYQDRGSPTNITHTISGQANTSLEGILYFPNQELNFSGGTMTDPVPSIIVADKVKFTGQSHFSDPTATTVAPSQYMIKVALVE